MNVIWRWRQTSLRWTILAAAPAGDAGLAWGDTWFASDLADALRRLGQRVEVVPGLEGRTPACDDDDVVVVLRGLRRFKRRKGRAVWLLWIISHPERVTPEEMASYDWVFAASTTWKPAGFDVVPLLQASNPARFNPDRAVPGTGERVLFVGSTRTNYAPNRPIVKAAIDHGVEIAVYGRGWRDVIDERFIRGDYLPNDEVGKAYRAAGVVLNDHWKDMAQGGFLSNRLFDAVAAGASVVSDEAAGLATVFDDAVVTYRSPSDIVAAIAAATARTEAAKQAAARRIHALHSFDARARTLLNTALVQKQKRRA